jgi:hypothetical protein
MRSRLRRAAATRRRSGMSAEEQLDALERGHYAESEGVGLLALAVEEINAELMADRAFDRGAFDRGTFDRLTPPQATRDPDRVRRWIERLHGATREVARRPGARGFTISVGFPAGVSVTIDWDIAERS